MISSSQQTGAWSQYSRSSTTSLQKIHPLVERFSQHGVLWAQDKLQTTPLMWETEPSERLRPQSGHKLFEEGEVEHINGPAQPSLWKRTIMELIQRPLWRPHDRVI